MNHDFEYLRTTDKGTFFEAIIYNCKNCNLIKDYIATADPHTIFYHQDSDAFIWADEKNVPSCETLIMMSILR